MKKTLLLAGVAALVSFNANAMEMKPWTMFILWSTLKMEIWIK